MDFFARMGGSHEEYLYVLREDIFTSLLYTKYSVLDVDDYTHCERRPGSLLAVEYLDECYAIWMGHMHVFNARAIFYVEI